MTCDIDNWLYVLKTGYCLNTGLPLNVLTSIFLQKALLQKNLKNLESPNLGLEKLITVAGIPWYL